MNKITGFLKKQIVLVVAWILAFISTFFVHPDIKYFSYIDWRSLGILWSLMTIMAAFRLNDVFTAIGNWLLSKVHKLWQLIFVLVFLCFFLSMFVTNDVSLITFVPFAILILETCNCQNLMIPVIVLQTIAANLGSMLTPIGNPQNLYLFGLGGFTLGNFVKLMLPYSSLSLVLLVLCIIILCKKEKSTEIDYSANSVSDSSKNSKKSSRKTVKLVVFTALFILSILTVLHILPFYVLVPIVLIVMMIFERTAVAKADYFLLLTFCGFFIFTGNIARIDFINKLLVDFVGGRELICGVVSSQIISNVPAALLLSGFSKSVSDLIVGVNLGGLGTLIASMASLISYKFYAASKNSKSGKYMIVFSVYNIIFLLILVTEYNILKIL